LNYFSFLSTPFWEFQGEYIILFDAEVGK